MDNLKTIVLDAFGGDNAPVEIVKGAIEAINSMKNIKVILTGKEDVINEELNKYKFDRERIEVVNADDVISNDDVPTVAIKQKTNSSLVVALELLKKKEDVIGLVSAGSTGAVLVGGLLKIGRIKGISRPALSPLVPNAKGTQTLLIDCGANMDTKPINLLHFALMGSEYMKNMFGIENPRVALLNVGVEDHKGNELMKKTFPLMKQLPINFVGNMEAREFLSGDYDVVVADGFNGNVLLKSTEGAVQTLLKILKKEIKSRFLSKIGAVLMSKTFKAVKGRLDYTSHGGSPFLGCNKIIIKSHGSSFAHSIHLSIKQVLQLHEAKMYDKLKEKLNDIKLEIEED